MTIEKVWEVAQTTTSPEVLRELSRHEDYRVRLQLAANKNTPVDVLRKLSLSADCVIRRYVAKNSNIQQKRLLC
jgi:hypothetical protein